MLCVNLIISSSCWDAGKPKTLICTSGSALKLLKCAVLKEPLGLIVPVRRTHSGERLPPQPAACLMGVAVGVSVPSSLCRGIWEALPWKGSVRRRRDSRREREVQLRPRLQGRPLLRLHGRVLQRRAERHLLFVRRWGNFQNLRFRQTCNGFEMCYSSSCVRMPRCLQDLWRSEQSGLWWVQGGLGGRWSRGLCW